MSGRGPRSRHDTWAALVSLATLGAEQISGQLRLSQMFGRVPRDDDQQFSSGQLSAPVVGVPSIKVLIGDAYERFPKRHKRHSNGAPTIEHRTVLARHRYKFSIPMAFNGFAAERTQQVDPGVGDGVGNGAMAMCS